MHFDKESKSEEKMVGVWAGVGWEGRGKVGFRPKKEKNMYSLFVLMLYIKF